MGRKGRNTEIQGVGGTAQTGAVTAEEGNIKVTGCGDVTTEGKLSAEKGAITVTSLTGNVEVKDGAVAENTVTLKADEGSIAVNGAVTSADEDVIAAADGDLTSDAISANGKVVLTSNKGNVQTGALTAENESVTVEAKDGITADGAVQARKEVSLLSKKGAISAGAGVTSEEEDVTINAKGDITANGAVQAGKEIALSSAEGSIHTVSGTDAYLDAGTHIALQAENGNVGSSDNVLRIRNKGNAPIDVTAKNAWLKGITNNSGDDSDTMTLQTVRVGNEFRTVSEGALTIKEATNESGETVTSVEAGTVGLTAARGIRVDGAVTAEEDVTAEAKGDVLVNSTVDAKTATLTAGDDVIIDRAITVVSDFTAKAKGRIYETESGVLKTTGDKDQVELEAGRGIAFTNENNSFIRLNVHGAENESAPGTYNAIDGNVSVTVNGDREWKVIAPEITDADIPVKGILATIGSPVNGNVTLTIVGENATVVLYKNGIVTNSGEAGEGNVSIATDKAIVVTQGIQAANNVAVTSNTGHVFVKNSLTAKAGSANVSTGEGNIHIGANVASGQGTALTTGNGNIHIGANIASGQGVALTTGNGKITVDNLVVANNGNVSLVTGAGDISVNDKVIARSGS